MRRRLKALLLAIVISCFPVVALADALPAIPTAVSATTASVPPVGIQFLTGLTCAIATSIVAPGYTVLWR